MIPSARVSQFHDSERAKLTVNQRELSVLARDVRVTVQHARNTVSRPPSVRHRCLRDEGLVHIKLGAALDVRVVVPVRAVPVKLGWKGSGEAFGDVLAEGSDLADFLEEDDGGFGRVAVDSDTCSSATVRRAVFGEMGEEC